jgi:alkanesulfonate monooxygenase SsuD/methylene tetrahydromethanopterin reductase-like flavin-dependent oxidoreductase (luciferase family)
MGVVDEAVEDGIGVGRVMALGSRGIKEMTESRVKFGLTLPNRGVVIAATTVAEMLLLAADAESEGWDSVWVGDSIFAKPVLTRWSCWGRLPPALRVCASDLPASPARRSATRYCWLTNGLISTSSLAGAPFSSPVRDNIAPHLFEREHRLQRTILALPQPHRAAASCSAAYSHLGHRQPHLNKKRNAEQAYRRVARLGDGWMTTFKSPEDVQTSLAMIREYAREMGHELRPDFEVAIYHNINVDEDRDRAFAEAKRFLDSYYSVDYRQDVLKLWVAAGSPAQCVQSLQRYVEAGATTILLRVVGYDQKGQFKRVTEEVLPAFS